TITAGAEACPADCLSTRKPSAAKISARQSLTAPASPVRLGMEISLTAVSSRRGRFTTAEIFLSQEVRSMAIAPSFGQWHSLSVMNNQCRDVQFSERKILTRLRQSVLKLAQDE